MFKRFTPLYKLNREREKLLTNISLAPCLRDVLSHPIPQAGTPLAELEFLVFDIETTGLNAAVDNILSVGYVTLKQSVIDLKSAKHFYVSSQQSVKAETAVINHIVPEMLQDGLAIDEVMNHLFAAMCGKVLVVHGSSVEKQFIERYVRQRYFCERLPLLWLDTLTLEKSLIANANHQKNGDYRLASVRSRYGLPEYNAHSALIDAIATAELFMAQTKRIFSNTPQVLNGVVKPQV
ncbi:exonuclease domain-containing protein [Agarivorans sp. TSD2052]|uniref:exonuclease domain-containing protein n=1 Tax=Agarivorans sp. TSD2052 TaxID=2937286 RepID=UPI00200FF239|nr:exonuclease domain-containing protein [Agarivorans sp. TSD2052]UPW20375.1 exonuclease domain-containing protein [Agarivorans sp. TSD2052]